MIVVDSSALLAILLEETDGPRFHAALSNWKGCRISAVNAHESITVLRFRKGAVAVDTLWRLLNQLDVEIVPFDEAQVHAAAAAFTRFGKGIHAKARLNLCDCAAYALAKTLDAPLLFKGDDFVNTDIAAAL